MTILTHVTRTLSIWKKWEGKVSEPDSKSWTPRVLRSDVELKDEVAKVLKQQGRKWRVQYTATSWSAHSRNVLNLRPGDEVKVVGREGSVLLIEPLETMDL